MTTRARDAHPRSVPRRSARPACWGAAALLTLAAIAAPPSAAAIQPLPAPAAARVVELREARRAGVVSALLSNGALVHCRRMDSPQTHLVVTLGGAEMLEDAANRGVSAVLAQALEGVAGPGGTNSPARIEVAAGPDALRFRVSGTVAAVSAAGPSLAALLSGPAPSDEAILAARERVVGELERLRTSPRLRVRDAVEALLASGSPPDPRLAPLTPAQVAAITPEMVRAWLERHVRGEQAAGGGGVGGGGGSPIEAAIAGDLPLDRALDIAREALGGLAPRAAPGPTGERLAAMRAAPWPARPTGPLMSRIAAEEGVGEPGRTIVLVAYLAPDPHEIARVRTLRAAARLLEVSARRRLESAGIPAPDETVGAGVTSSPLPGRSMLLLTADVPDARAGEAADILRAVFADAAANAPEAGELEREATQLVATLQSFNRDAGYWASLLARVGAMDLDIEDVGLGQSFYAALSPEAVRAAVAGVVEEARRVEMVVGGAGEK